MKWDWKTMNPSSASLYSSTSHAGSARPPEKDRMQPFCSCHPGWKAITARVPTSEGTDSKGTHSYSQSHLFCNLFHMDNSQIEWKERLSSRIMARASTAHFKVVGATTSKEWSTFPALKPNFSSMLTATILQSVAISQSKWKGTQNHNKMKLNRCNARWHTPWFGIISKGWSVQIYNYSCISKWRASAFAANALPSMSHMWKAMFWQHHVIHVACMEIYNGKHHMQHMSQNDGLQALYTINAWYTENGWLEAVCHAYMFHGGRVMGWSFYMQAMWGLKLSRSGIPGVRCKVSIVTSSCKLVALKMFYCPLPLRWCTVRNLQQGCQTLVHVVFACTRCMCVATNSTQCNSPSNPSCLTPMRLHTGAQVIEVKQHPCWWDVHAC